MTWYAFKGLNGGKAIDIAGITEKDATLQGFHGYATEAQAEAHPNAVNIVTRGLADALIAEASAEQQQKAGPGEQNASNLAAAAGQAVANDAAAAARAAANDIPGVAQAGDFFGALTQKNTWIRVGKIAIGGLLLIIGLAHITGAGNAVATAARKVPVPV